jgi:pimeloyl-ACP methyl ester carboxylesterase
MAELSPTDIELLSRSLPELARSKVESDIFSERRGIVEYRAAGDPSNPAVVMLHGLGSNSAGYRAQFAGLSQDFYVLAWNAPGFGNSSQVGSQSATIGEYADALEGVLSALGHERLAGLVGSSWGSVIALAFASRYPERVGSLILSAPNVAKGHLRGESRDAELEGLLRIADISIPVSRAGIADRLLTPKTPALVRQHVERLRDAMTTAGWRQAIRSLFTIHTPDVIGTIKAPIAILSGTRDQVAPYADHAARLFEAATWSKMYTFEGCGHILKLEAPSKFNSAVRETLASG